jgi:aryl-alcohol dehydrogenase-like predicted oxidoreductase
MAFRDRLPELTRFTFGTGKVDRPDDPQHVRVVRMAMDAGVWFHSSHVYSNGKVFETLKKAFAEDPKRIPKCIFKVDGLGADLLRETVMASIAGTGVERVDIAQVCGNPDIAELRPGSKLHDTMVELKEKGLVGSYVFEIFWRGSPNALKALQEDLFDGYIFYYNVVNREVSNELFDALHEKQADILALRTVGGGVEVFHNPGDAAAAKAALEAIYRRSGCKTPLEFRVRYVLSDPQVRTTIGATGNPQHLTDLLKACEEAEPLPADIVNDVHALHRTWFAEKGLW